MYSSEEVASDDEACCYLHRTEKEKVTRKTARSAPPSSERRDDERIQRVHKHSSRKKHKAEYFCPKTWEDFFSAQRRGGSGEDNGFLILVEVTWHDSKYIYPTFTPTSSATIDPRCFVINGIKTNELLSTSILFINDIFRTPFDALSWIRTEVEDALAKTTTTNRTRSSVRKKPCTTSVRYTSMGPDIALEEKIETKKQPKHPLLLRLDGIISSLDMPVFSPGCLRRQLCLSNGDDPLQQYSMFDCLDSGIQKLLSYSSTNNISEVGTSISSKGTASSVMPSGIPPQLLVTFFRNTVTKSLSEITTAIFDAELCQQKPEGKSQTSLVPITYAAYQYNSFAELRVDQPQTQTQTQTCKYNVPSSTLFKLSFALYFI